MVGTTLSLYGEVHMLSCVCKSARARVYVWFVHVAYVYIIYYNRPTILLTQKILVSPHARYWSYAYQDLRKPPSPLSVYQTNCPTGQYVCNQGEVCFEVLRFVSGLKIEYPNLHRQT